jgi:uncharacterized phage protein gp47/JayE
VKSSQEYSQQIRTQLKVLDPDISAEPLTVERKIIDTVADTIASASIDQYVLQYQYDIDSKAGSDLDKFVALFGFARQSGRQATGIVTFSRQTPSTTDVPIAAGTQVQRPGSSVNTSVLFFTTATVVLVAGTTEVDAPVEAAIVGPLGNVPAGTITVLVDGNGDLSTVTNENGTAGGADIESDAELRVRFKNTIFRNIAGTQDQYLALAIASQFANKANVLGPISRFIEYAQVANDTPTPGDLGIVSEVPYSKYTYPFDYFVTDGSVFSEVFYTPRGVDFTFADTVPPSITVDNTTTLPLGTIVLMEHAYCSINSRNDPDNNIANYVDVYVSGSDDTNASESAVFPTSTNDLNNTPGSDFYVGNFVRAKTSDTPAIGNRFQELLWQPADIAPSAITIEGSNYVEGVDYWLVRDITILKGSKRARNGIEWSSGVADDVTPGTEFVINYIFDKLPLVLNELMDSHKQITTDVLVHSATERFFIINITIMYTPGFVSSSVNDAISATVENFLERQQFGAVIQISDLLEIIHEVPGVDNVRLTNSADGASYGVQEMAADGISPIGTPYITDFALQDSDLPVLQSVVTTQRSQNTWN